MDENKKNSNFLSFVHSFYIWFVLISIGVLANWTVFLGIVQYNDGDLQQVFLGIPALAIFVVAFLFLALGVFYKKISPNIRYLLLLLFTSILCVERTIQYFPRSLLPKTPFYALLSGLFVLGIALWCSSSRTLSREPYTLLTISLSSVISGSCVIFMISLYPYIIINTPVLLVLSAFVLAAFSWSCKIWLRQDISAKQIIFKQFFLYFVAYFFWFCVFFYAIYNARWIFPFLKFPLKFLILSMATLIFIPAILFLFGKLLTLHKIQGPSSDIFPYRKNILQFFALLVLVFGGIRVFYLYSYPPFPWELKKILGAGYSKTLFVSPALGFSIKQNNALTMTEDGGMHWREVFLDDFTPHKMRFLGERTGLLLGKENNKIAYTLDSGKNWIIKSIKGFRPYQIQQIIKKDKEEIEKPLNNIEYPPIEEEKNSSYLPVLWTDAAILSPETWIVIGHEYSNSPEDIYFGMDKIDWEKKINQESLNQEESESQVQIERYSLPYLSFIMKTEDAGENWKILKKGTGILKEISCSSWGLIAGDPVLISEDRGQTWKKLPIPTDIFEQVLVVKDNIALAVRRNTLYMTRDTGKSWQRLYEPSRKGLALTIHDFFSIDAQSAFIASQDILPKEKYEHNYRFHSVVLYSADQGQSWKKEMLPLTARIHNFFLMRDRLSLTAESPYGTLIYSRSENYE